MTVALRETFSNSGIQQRHHLLSRNAKGRGTQFQDLLFPSAGIIEPQVSHTAGFSKTLTTPIPTKLKSSNTSPGAAINLNSPSQTTKTNFLSAKQILMRSSNPGDQINQAETKPESDTQAIGAVNENIGKTPLLADVSVCDLSTEITTPAYDLLVLGITSEAQAAQSDVADEQAPTQLIEASQIEVASGVPPMEEGLSTKIANPGSSKTEAPSTKSGESPSGGRQIEFATDRNALPIDQSWVAESPKVNQSSNIKQAIQLVSAFSLDIGVQPKSDPAGDLLYLRMHVSPKTTVTPSANMGLQTQTAAKLPSKDGVQEGQINELTFIDTTAQSTSPRLPRNMSDSGQNDNHNEFENLLSNQPPPSSAQSFNSTNPKGSSNTGSIPAEQISLTNDPAMAPKRSVSQIVLHLGQGESSHIAVRIQSKATGVSMDIQGSDPQVRASLQESISKLENTLKGHGMASTWTVPGIGKEELDSALVSPSQQGSGYRDEHDSSNHRERTSHSGDDFPNRKQRSKGDDSIIPNWNKTFIEGATI